MIELGDKVRDKITGFEGIAVSKTEHLNGCVHFGVQAKMLKGEMPEAEYIDIEQLVVVRKAKAELKEPTGGPKDFRGPDAKANIKR